MVSNVRVGLGVTLLLGLTLSALLMLMATAPSQAQTAGNCQAQFTELRADTESLTITGGKIEKERAGLLKLVDDAQALASIGKTSDAVKKLSDFTVKVDQLEAAGRISADSADILLAKTGAVIDCIDPPEEPSPTTA
jgi:hypothetical protein